MIDTLQTALQDIKSAKPLILNITNFVTMDFMANALLAIGAAPIMTVCNEELEELVAISSAININLGTLDNAFIERCERVIELASRYKKSIILDPVGSGATQIRTKTARDLMQHASIIRGNASEIISLAEAKSRTHGVESMHSTIEAKEIALDIARKYKCTVVVSGAVDFITDGAKQSDVPYGSDMMPLVTGMGCTLTSVISAFHAVIQDAFEASVLATTYFGLCGQLTKRTACNPGTFRTHFIDNLHAADFNRMSGIYAE